MDALISLGTEAQVLSRSIRALLPRWPGSVSRSTDPADVLDCLHVHLDLARLQTAGSIRKSLLDAIGRGDTAMHDEIRTLALRSEEHTSELQSLMRISYAVFCL